MKSKIFKNCPLAKNVNVYSYDSTTTIIIEALEEKDFPHGISNNGKYIKFRIEGEKLEAVCCGYVHLSLADKQTDEYKYYVMRSMFSLLPKKMRKCKIKSEDDAVNKMSKYFNDVMKALTEYTGGYPYYEGK